MTRPSVNFEGYAHDHHEVCRRTTLALEQAGRSGEALVFNERAVRVPGQDALLQVVRDYCVVTNSFGVIKVL